MAKIVQVHHQVYGEVELNVERVIAVCLDKNWLLFEDCYWPLSESDFNKVYKVWKGEK